MALNSARRGMAIKLDRPPDGWKLGACLGMAGKTRPASGRRRNSTPVVGSIRGLLGALRGGVRVYNRKWRRSSCARLCARLHHEPLGDSVYTMNWRRAFDPGVLCAAVYASTSRSGAARLSRDCVRVYIMNPLPRDGVKLGPPWGKGGKFTSLGMALNS
jgi:hypothetical protein